MVAGERAGVRHTRTPGGHRSPPSHQGDPGHGAVRKQRVECHHSSFATPTASSVLHAALRQATAVLPKGVGGRRERQPRLHRLGKPMVPQAVRVRQIGECRRLHRTAGSIVETYAHLPAADK